MYIYRFSNLKNDKVYIGKTTQSVGRRERKHLSNAIQGNNELPFFYRAIRKYGPESFLIEILAYASTELELNALEQFHIQQHRSHLEEFGYNLTLGGDGGQKTPAARRHMSEAHKGKTLSVEHRRQLSLARKDKPIKRGPDNGNFGKKHSKEWSLAISQGQLGKILTQAHKDKISRAHTGKQLTADHCQKVAEALRGVRKSPAHCLKLSEWQKGKRKKPLSTEHRGRISMGLQGHKCSEECRKKISAAWTPERKAALADKTRLRNKQRALNYA